MQTIAVKKEMERPERNNLFMIIIYLIFFNLNSALIYRVLKRSHATNRSRVVLFRVKPTVISIGVVRASVHSEISPKTIPTEGALRTGPIVTITAVNFNLISS